MENTEFKPYSILKDECTGQYEEKKSRFIAYLSPCKSEEDAALFIEGIRKKHYDARHNCTAYILGEKSAITRCSDDGEPAGTAGKPMLEVLLKTQLTNVVCVVTRYFGGTLLGTGGLVRAYQSAVKDALSHAEILTVLYCADIEIKIAYNDVNPVQHYLSEEEVRVLSTEYLESVSIKIRLPKEMAEEIIKNLTSVTSGRAQIDILKTGYEAL